MRWSRWSAQGSNMDVAAGTFLALFLTWLVGYPLLLTFLEAMANGGAAFAEFARRGDEWQALWRSLWISAASVFFSALLGVPLAFLFERADFPGRRVLGALVPLPIALPPLVGVISFLFLYGESGFVPRLIQGAFGLEQSPWTLEGAPAILLVHTYSMFVYFYLFVRAALARFDASMLEAAAALGASRWRIFWQVELPQLRPALLGASLLTFMTSLGSFSAPYIFGGGFRVMTTQILASKMSGNTALAQAEAIVLATLALAALALIRYFQGGELTSSSHGVAPRPVRLQASWQRWTAAIGAGLLTTILLLPHLTLFLISFVPRDTWTTELLPPAYTLANYQHLADTERLRPLLNSLWMATVATLAAVTLGLLAARASRRLGGTLGSILEGLIALPWAIPGTVFALALGTAFSIHQPLLGRFVFVGTAVILPLAYLVRCLPVTGRSALAGLRQLDPAQEEAASGLGAGRLRTFFRVVLPAVRPALAAGLGLAFITGLGDFVTSIILYTFDTRPISIEIAAALRLQEFGAAAAYGVILMLLSGTAFLIWGRGEET